MIHATTAGQSAPSARIAARSITRPPEGGRRARRVTIPRVASSRPADVIPVSGPWIAGQWVVIGRLQLGPRVRRGAPSAIVARPRSTRGAASNHSPAHFLDGAIESRLISIQGAHDGAQPTGELVGPGSHREQLLADRTRWRRV